MTTDVHAAAEELFSMMESEKETGPRRAVFLRINDRKTHPDPRTREIGEGIYSRYGMDGMHTVGNILTRKVQTLQSKNDPRAWYMRSDLRELDCAWNGIGDWQS